MKSSEQSTFHMSPFTSNFVTFLSKEGIGHCALHIVGKVTTYPQDAAKCRKQRIEIHLMATILNRERARVKTSQMKG